jgi:hypothetical protein
MATPVAHFTVGTIVLSSAALWGWRPLPFLDVRWVLFFGVLGCLPDFDMAIGLLLRGDSTSFHFGVSHSFAFAGLAASALAIYWRVGGNAWFSVMAVAAFFAVASHVLIDWATGPRVGNVPSRGLAVWWPVFDHVVHTPFTVFKGVDRSLPGGTFSFTNLRSALLEAVVLVPVAAVSIRLARARR